MLTIEIELRLITQVLVVNVNSETIDNVQAQSRLTRNIIFEQLKK